MSTAVVSEIFASVQGEGRAIGVPMTFVRLAHCNIECVWCDTPQRKTGTRRELEDVGAAVVGLGVRDVCFTGGEPMLQLARIRDLLLGLVEGGYRLHLETNGTISPDGHRELLNLFTVITVSPKLPSAQHPDPVSPLERKQVFDESAFRAWCSYSEENDAVSFKYVLEDNDTDWAHFRTHHMHIPETTEVIIQPQTYQPDAYARLGNRISQHIGEGWPQRGWARVRYLPRLHELIWGDAPGR